jgi:hypothetical protein
MRGSFSASHFRFEVARTDVDLGSEDRLQELLDEEFDLRLSNSGRLPNLGGAPVASWLLARLGKLTADGIRLFGEEENDGGGYMVELLVYDERETPVAVFQLQGNSMGAAILGDCILNCSPGDILDALAAALLAAPADLVTCRLGVYDLEWEEVPESFTPEPNSDSRNWYGWDRNDFLGASNIRERL